MEVRRIGADGGFIREYSDFKKRVKALETGPTGNIVVRDSVTAVDPVTGVETILGVLPDGTTGFLPFVGDTEPPPVSTPASVSATPGTMTIRWNGQFVGGAKSPNDFQHVNVISYKIVDGSPVKHKTVGLIRTAKDSLLVGTDMLRAGDKWAFTLVSEDFNGNEASESLMSEYVTMLDAISPVDEAWIDMLEDIEESKKKSSELQLAADKAQAAADAAASEALKAIGAANGKGKVVFSSSPPGEEDRNAQTLWIDITGGGNTPKRWNGTAWVEVTDKKILDAAQAAANAEEKASQAFNKAVSAATAAGEAQTAANGKNRNWYQTTAPTGTDHKDGDIWFDTANGNQMKIWKASTNKWESIDNTRISAAASSASAAQSAASTAQSAADKAIADALAASGLAAGKSKVLFQTTAPGTADRANTLWIDITGGANTPKRWDGAKWAAVTDKVAVDAASTAAAAADRANEAYIKAETAATNAGLAQQTADSKNKVWYLDTKPAGDNHRVNDLWYDSANGNRPMRWNGTAWVSAQDAAIAIAKSEAAAAGSAAGVAQETANEAATAAAEAASSALAASNLAATKGKVLAQPTAPTGVDANAQTLWIDTSGTPALNTPKRWVSGTTWAAVTDKAATDAAALATSKGKVIIQSSAPATADRLVQNLWIDTTGGANTPKRWNSSTSKWDTVTDKTATDAAAAAVTAQTAADKAIADASSAAITAGQALTSANGKSTVRYSGTMPAGTGYNENDLWFDSANGNKPMRWDGTKWASIQDAAIAAAQGLADSALTSANGKNKVVFSSSDASGTNYSAGDVWFKRNSSGTIIGQWEFTTSWQKRTVGDEVIANLTAGKITAGFIDADRLKAEDIRAKIVAAEKINADEILVKGSITAESGVIGSLDAGKITVGEMDGVRIKANSIDASQLLIGSGDNLINNPQMIDGRGWSNPSAGTGSGMSTDFVYPGMVQSQKLVQRAAGVSTPALYAGMPTKVSVNAGESYYVSSYIWATGDSPFTNISQRVYFYDSSGSQISGSTGNAAPVGGTIYSLATQQWVEVGGQIEVPAGAVAMVPRITVYYPVGYTPNNTVYYVGNVSIRRVVGTTLIRNGAITTDHMTVGTIDGKVITAASLKGTQIEARSISTDNLLITSTDNLIQEADFGAKGAGWSLLGTTSITPSGGRNGGPALRFTASTGNQTVFNKYTASVEPGNQYRLTAWIKPSVNIAANTFTFMAVSSASTGTKTYIKTYAPAVSANTWGTVTGIITIPANSVSVQFALELPSTITSGTVDVDFAEVSRAADGTLIVDGSIKASSIATGQINSGHIVSGSINSTHIASKSITTDKLLVTSSDNFILEPDFSNQGYSWELNETNRIIEATAGRGGGPALRFKSSTSALTSKNRINKIPVGQDDRFRASVFYKTDANLTAGRVSLRIRCYTTATAYTDIIAVQNPAETTSGTWKQLQGIAPSLPSGTIAVEFYLRVQNPATTTITDIDFVSVTRAFTGSLIVDGAIDGQTITGATLRTATTGSRIQIDSSGLQAFDASNIRYLNVSNGSLEMVGTLSARGTTSWGTVIDAKIGTRSAFVGSNNETIVGMVTSPGLGFIKVPPTQPPGSIMPVAIDAEPAGLWSYDGDVVLLNSTQTTIPIGQYVGLQSPRLILDPTGAFEGGYAEINAPKGLRVKSGPHAFSNVAVGSLTEVQTINGYSALPRVMGYYHYQTGIPRIIHWGPGKPALQGSSSFDPVGGELFGSWINDDIFTVSSEGVYTVNWHLTWGVPPSSGWMQVGSGGYDNELYNLAITNFGNNTFVQASVSPVYLPAGGTLHFKIAHLASSNNTARHKISITKLA